MLPPEEEKEFQISKYILDEFYRPDKKSDIHLKKQLFLEIELTFNDGYRPSVSMTFKIGEKRLYNLNNKILKGETKMIITQEQSLEQFKAWQGAKHTQERLINEGMAEDFEEIIEGLYPQGIDETELNDILWFEEDWIFEMLGISDEEEEENED